MSPKKIIKGMIVKWVYYTLFNIGAFNVFGGKIIIPSLKL